MPTLENSYKNSIKNLEKQTETIIRKTREKERFTKEISPKYNFREVKGMPSVFYCEWLPTATPDQRKLKEDTKKKCSTTRNGCANHWWGLPTLKFGDDQSQGMPLNGYEKRMLQFHQENNYYALNKCRGAGASEIKTVRWDAFKYGILNKTLGKKCLTMAGQNQETAIKFLHRIKLLCDTHTEIYLFPPKTDFPKEIFFAQGGSICAMPAVPNSVRSLENVGDINIEEAAFWERIDDGPVLKAVEPHVIKSRAHISNITTPNGKRGYFWDKIFNPESDTKYFRHTLNWREVVGIPEPDPEVLTDYDGNDPNTKEQIKKTYLHLYKNDKKYKQWFHDFFGARDINEILDVAAPILDIKEIVNMYKTDRPEYDQELDNQFITSQNKVFGNFLHEDFPTVDFSDINFEKDFESQFK